MAEHLELKWGTLKGWSVETDASKAALKKLFDLGERSMSVMLQDDTTEQKDALCELIDVIDGPITNDWSGETYASKEDAKTYVREYIR